MQSFWNLGKKIYNMSNLARKRVSCVVFCARAMANRSDAVIDRLFSAGCSPCSRWRMFGLFVYEQPTRAFFYNKSI